MPTTATWLSDTQATVLDGMHRGREPELLPEQQAALLRNLSTRGGRARSRPRIVRRATLPAGLLQGAAIFSRTGTVLVALGGVVHELDPRTWARTAKNAGDPNSPKQPRAWFCETAGTLVIQDDQSRPCFYDGASFRRAAADEVPVGSAMAFGNGRLAVVVGRRNVRLGDIRQPDHQSELKFTEWSALNGGGDFAFQTDVLALGVLPVIDTGSGQGSLIVGCADSTHSLKTNITQRDLWAEVGMQTVVFPNRGIAGGNALVAVNQDLYFRSSDGLRSVRTSTADYDAPGLAPLSAEVRHRFDYDTPFLLRDASVVYFDNRVLCTHSPFHYGPRSLAQGLVALNFDALSGRGMKAPPCFDGEWDGFGVIAQLCTGIVRGVERCFILGRDTLGVNCLWELLPEAAHQEGDSPTQALETRTLFAGSPGQLKNLRRADVMFSDIRTALAARVYFRPDKYPFWVLWDEFAVAAAPTGEWGRARPQRRSLLATREVPFVLDPQTGRPVSCATGFQVRIEWEGFARLDYLQLWQEPADLASYADNATSTAPADPGVPPAGQSDPAFWYAHPVSPLAGI